MKRTVLIAKCIEIIKLNEKTLYFKFDKEIDFNSKYIQVNNFSRFDINCIFKSGKILYIVYPEFIDDCKTRAERWLLNKYCLLRSSKYNSMFVVPDPINKEVLWQDLSNLENPELEEIDCYIRMLNG